MAERIAESVPGVQALTQAELVDKNISDLSEGFLPIIWVLTVISLAIGFSNRQLLRIVIQQAITAGAIGLALGVVLTFGLAPLIEQLVPQVVVSIQGFDLGFAAVAALLMAIVSSFVPVRRVMRLDPAQVFRV